MKRMFASKRAEVGSTLEGSSVDAACDCDGAFLSAMSSVLQTVYGISAPKNGANRTAMAGTERLALTESPTPLCLVILRKAKDLLLIAMSNIQRLSEGDRISHAFPRKAPSVVRPLQPDHLLVHPLTRPAKPPLR